MKLLVLIVAVCLMLHLDLKVLKALEYDEYEEEELVKGEAEFSTPSATGKQLMQTFSGSPCSEYSSEQCGQSFLQLVNEIMENNMRIRSLNSFAYSVDLNNASLQAEMLEIGAQITQIDRKLREEAKKFHIDSFNDSIKRQFRCIRESIISEDQEKMRTLQSLSSSLENLYANSRACPEGMKCFPSGEQDVEHFMGTERDYDRLSAVWKAWHEATGPRIAQTFTKWMQLENEVARENGFKDVGYATWFLDMKENDFDSQVLALFQELKPLYEKLHAFARYRLRAYYPGRFGPRDPIPAHILGNPWAQQWFNIEDLLKPFPQLPVRDINPKLKNFSIHEMVKTAEQFFTSLGLPAMTEDFWKNSVFQQHPPKVMQCHASASDLVDGKDFRIKMCGRQDATTFSTLHHEMGHVEYYMLYKDQPYLFRGGANSAFHEAVGDTISLAVQTPSHLKTIGLLDQTTDDDDSDLNDLMKTALSKVVFLPFGLLCDVWSWRVANGSVPPEDYNREWWRLRMELQGVMPPVPREKRHVDALAKYHLAVGVPYIRYFLSFIMQFQFYEALCINSGHKGPLHKCDFYHSKAAGDILRSVLSLGCSQPWEEAMRRMTGQPRVSTAAILHYFAPLQAWLEREIADRNIPVGWDIPSSVHVA